MHLFLFLICLLYILQTYQCVEYGVSLTSIPPRYDFITKTISSLIHQLHRPIEIVIHIPNKYKRFNRENMKRKVLTLNNSIRRLNTTGINIIVQTVSEDLGPLTKFLGIFQRYASNSYSKYPDYWIFCDDDVKYSKYLIRDYNKIINQLQFLSDLGTDFIFTHFKPETRINFDEIMIDSSETTHIEIQHVQGVDTFMVSHQIILNILNFFTPCINSSDRNKLSDNILNQNSSLNSLFQIQSFFSFFHQTCPESFFQDDYLISLFFHYFNYEIFSIWIGKKMALHLKNISKSNFQLHMEKNVFYREEITKKCIIDSYSHVKKSFFIKDEGKFCKF